MLRGEADGEGRIDQPLESSEIYDTFRQQIHAARMKSDHFRKLNRELKRERMEAGGTRWRPSEDVGIACTLPSWFPFSCQSTLIIYQSRRASIPARSAVRTSARKSNPKRAKVESKRAALAAATQAEDASIVIQELDPEHISGGTQRHIEVALVGRKRAHGGNVADRTRNKVSKNE